MRRRTTLLFCGILLAVFVLTWGISAKGSYWDNTRLRVVSGSSSGSSVYILFDPRKGVVSLYPLDKEEEIETAYGLGQWKIGSLWKLGEQEKKGGGVMLRKSLMRGKGLPVEGYIHASSVVSPFQLARVLLTGLDTDLVFADRVKLAWFTMRAKMDFKDTFSEQAVSLTGEDLRTLTDGIVTIYSPDEMHDSSLKAVSDVVSNLGGKVLDISRTEDAECSVKGVSDFARKLARVFSCTYVSDGKEGVEFRIGTNLAREF